MRCNSGATLAASNRTNEKAHGALMKKFAFAILTVALILLPRELSAQQVRAGAPQQFGATTTGSCDFARDTSTQQRGHGFDLANLDRAVKPCDDFVHFAVGGWLKNNPAPADHPRWGIWDTVVDHNQEILHQILEEAAKIRDAAPGSVQQKIGDFYASCIDTDEIEKAGLDPLQPELKRIASLANTADLETEFARFQTRGISVPFSFSSFQDFKESTHVIGIAYQDGLSLPERDYYTQTDEKSQKLREAYVQHVTKMFELMGDDATAAAAETKAVMALETKLALASMTPVEQRDPDHIYHMMSSADLMTLTPDFSWPAFFRGIGSPAMDSINVGQPDFFKVVNAQLKETSLADWKSYLRWHLVHDAAPALSSKFVDENFNFFGRALTGTTEILPRWKRCVQATDNQLGEALGQEYVKRAFPPEAKAQALVMIHNLIAALRDDLTTLDWMGPETRKQALAKLNAITLKVGYPDKWRDYSAYQVIRGPYIEDVWRGDEFEFRRDLAKIGKPVDRSEWGMTPPRVDAYYSSSMNEIVFPAGILQPPFFDPKGDDAMNYGGIGAVIGHEMTHGFDDEGARFDAQGNLKNWWTPEDLKNFQARSECIIKQFDGYEVEPGLHENGKLVVGESIADFGGLTIAHAAYEKSLEGKPRPADIDGFTDEQRFFLAWAQIWASNEHPEFARLLANVDPHALGRFRTIGPLSNMPSFSRAFGCSASSPMVRADSVRCRIW
jgi:putative endopeptidase